jgi:hypothetical protein
MKRLLTLTLLSIALTTSNASILGASSYEDCILENMKNVSNSEVANQIAAACRTKFPSKAAPSRSRNGIKECRLYWDGWKLVKGVKPSEEFKTLILSFDGTPTLFLSLHKKMLEELGADKMQPGTNLDGKMDAFISKNMPTINAYCAN